MQQDTGCYPEVMQAGCYGCAGLLFLFAMVMIIVAAVTGQ